MGKILVIDDDPFNLKMADFSLKKNHEVTLASSGAAALEIMRGEMFDLILLDLLMPGMDGYEVLKEIRAISGYEFVPVLFLTAETEPQLREKAYNAGALEIIPKPFKTVELLEMVSKFLS